jgi:hypothetical protein
MGGTTVRAAIAAEQQIAARPRTSITMPGSEDRAALLHQGTDDADKQLRLSYDKHGGGDRGGRGEPSGRRGVRSGVWALAAPSRAQDAPLLLGELRVAEHPPLFQVRELLELHQPVVHS